MTRTRIEVVAQPDEGGWTCEVTVTSLDGTSSRHAVRVTPADLARLDPDATEPGDLVRRSFAFLLEREDKGSILQSFDLPVIGRYFPEYEATIRSDPGRPQDG